MKARNLGRALALGAMLVASGCTTNPAPLLDATTPDRWRNARTVADSPADLRTWWRRLGDARLDDLVTRALAGNLRVAEGVERVQAARVLSQYSGSRFLPALRAGTDNEVNPSASASYLVASLDATWELGLFGRRAGTQQALAADAASAAAALEGVRVSLVGEVVAVALQLGAACEQRRLIDQAVALQDRQRTTLESAVQLGLAPRSALEALVSAGTRTRTQASLQTARIDALAQQLAVLLGEPQPEPEWSQMTQFGPIGEPPPIAAPADVLRHRPDVQQAEAAVLAASGEAAIARAERLPRIDIGGSIRWSSNLIRNTPRISSTYQIASLGPVIDIPLFDWGMRRAQSESRQSLLRASALAYRDAVLRAYAEVEIALGALHAQADREARAEEALRSSQQLVAAVTRRQALRLASDRQAQAAAIDEIEARMALLEARTDHALAYVALFKALGGAPL